MRVSEVLDGAADLIEAAGWWDGTMGTSGHCAVTAIVHSVGTASEIEQALSPLRRRVGQPIPMWNDEHDADTVIETLRKVAAEARWTE